VNVEQLNAAHTAATTRAIEVRTKIDEADDATITEEDIATLQSELVDAVTEVERTRTNLELRIKQDQILDADPVDVPEPIQRTSATAKGSLRTENIYRPDSFQARTPMFFRDLWRAKNGDPRAYERLERNNREYDDMIQQRAGVNQTLTSGGDFVYPVFLAEFAAKLRAGRATMDAIGPKPWIATNSINLPAITTGATTSIQADGSSVSNTDLVTATITAAAQTASGRTVASYQVIDLGEPGLDQAIFQDLLASLNQTKDIAVINGSVTNAKGLLQVTGINTVTYTDASPTFQEFYLPNFQAKSLIESNAFDSPNFIVLHPKVWNSFLSDLDTAGRPLALSVDSAAFNALAGFEYAGQGLVGSIAGLPVITDANVPATLGGGTETAAILLNRRGFDLYEDAPSFKMADQTSITTLQIQFVLWGYYAVLSRQPKMISKITGTGMIPRAGF
jgi:hypothetical protein